MKRLGIISLFFPAIFAVTAQTNTASPAPGGTNAPVREMSLRDCVQEALAHNLDVQIQRYNPAISLYNLNAAYAGYDPTFNISGQHNFDYTPNTINPNSTNIYPSFTSKSDSFDSSIGGSLPWGLQYDLIGNVSQQKKNSDGFMAENSPGSIQVQLTQPLLKNFWIDNTRLTIRVAKNRLQYSQQGLRDQIISTVTDVANAYYELIYARENVRVQQDALTLAQTQLSQDQRRVEIGALAPLSVQQDESQVAQSQANVIAAQETLSVDQNTLKNLLADTNYMTWHGVDIQPAETLEATMQEFNLQDSWNKGMSERPDLLQARLNIEQQGIQLKFYRNQLFPELDLFGTYGYNGSGPQYSDSFGEISRGNAPFYTYGAKLSMPLGNFGARNQIKSTKASLQQVVLQLKQLEQNVMVQIDNAVKLAQSDYQSVQATRQARIYAEAALDAEQKTYAVGKATTFEVLQYQNNLTAARSNEIRALANYNEALANLAAQEGSTMEKYGIDLDTK